MGQPIDTAPRAMPRRRSRRRVLGWLTVAVVVGLLLGVWRAGGFAEGHRRTTVERGQWIDIGPASIAAHSATARRIGDEWQVTVRASCRVDEGLPFRLGTAAMNGMAVIADTPAPRVVSERVYLTFSTDDFGGRDYLAPSLEPTECLLKAQMPSDFRPEDGILFGAGEQVFRDDSVTRNQGPRWTFDGRVWQVPLTVTLDE